MYVVGAPSVKPQSSPITVPLPVVTRHEFIDYSPEELLIDEESRSTTKIQRSRAWYQLVKIASIDLTGTHGLATIQAQFGGKPPIPSPLLFNDHPPVEVHRFIDREKVDRLSIPTLGLFVVSINEELATQDSPIGRKNVLDHRLGSNVGIVALQFMDAAVRHFS